MRACVRVAVVYSSTEHRSKYAVEEAGFDISAPGERKNKQKNVSNPVFQVPPKSTIAPLQRAAAGPRAGRKESRAGLFCCFVSAKRKDTPREARSFGGVNAVLSPAGVLKIYRYIFIYVLYQRLRLSVNVTRFDQRLLRLLGPSLPPPTPKLHENTSTLAPTEGYYGTSG